MKRFFATAIFSTVSCALIFCASTDVMAQTFQRLSAHEKQAYVKEKAHRIGAAITGRSSDLSPDYLALVSARVEAYAERISSNIQEVVGREDLRLVLARGAKYAPAFAKIFQARN